MGDKGAKERLQNLGQAAADFVADNNIPIRRYFRSGNEMIKMATVYHAEGNLEAAYLLYMKFATLHVDKLPKHRDYNGVIPAEKKKVRVKVGDVMEEIAKIKDILRRQFEVEHDVWCREEVIREKERRRREEEEAKRRNEAANARAAEVASIERDRQVALWHQAVLDAEARGEPPPSKGPPPPPPSYPPSSPSLREEQDLDLPRYEPSKYEEDNTDPFPSAPPSSSSSPPPSYDRAIKPSSPHSSSISCSVPSVDRTSKPLSTNSSSSLRKVVVPSDLMNTFLQVASQNSGRGIETLGTLGGSLKNNQLVISHLVIPKQSGKSDSCTMEGLEDVWEVYDRLDIIFLGWIHTHPEYDVFLSSVDMHNQYEWQHMLPEAIAIVCSIKFNQVGFLTLTPAGLAEIGSCNKTNFHPHSKEPPLFEETRHIDLDQASSVKLMDLR